MIEDLDLEKLDQREPVELTKLLRAVSEVGFLTVSNAGLSGERVCEVISVYRDFFCLPEAQK